MKIMIDLLFVLALSIKSCNSCISTSIDFSKKSVVLWLSSEMLR